MTATTVDLLVVDDGTALRGYDCRDVVRVEEVAGEAGSTVGYLVRLGRLGPPREIVCREILEPVSLSAREIRPVPEALKGRVTGEMPWGVGITEKRICLLY